MGFVLTKAAHGRFRGVGVDNLQVYAGVLVKAQLLGHVIPGKLGLRGPLRGEDIFLLRFGGPAEEQRCQKG